MPFVLAIFAALFIGCGEPTSSHPSTVAPPTLSSDTALSITKVCGYDVTDGAVTMSEERWLSLSCAQDPEGYVEYECAPKATVTLAVNDKILSFTVTAEDGTTKNHTVVVTVTVDDTPVLSSDTYINIVSVGGAVVTDGKATLTTAQFNTVKSNALGSILYAAHAKSTVTAALSDNKLNVTVTAEDGSRADHAIELTVLSDITTFTVWEICGAEIKDNAATLTSAQYRELQRDKENAIEYLSPTLPRWR